MVKVVEGSRTCSTRNAKRKQELASSLTKVNPDTKFREKTEQLHRRPELILQLKQCGGDATFNNVLTSRDFPQEG